MVVGAHDAAEGRMREAAELLGVRLAPVEEGVAEPVAAVRLQQHGFAAVEDLVEVEAGLLERLGELVGVLDHRRRGRGADDLVAVARDDAHGALCAAASLARYVSSYSSVPS